MLILQYLLWMLKLWKYLIWHKHRIQLIFINQWPNSQICNFCASKINLGWVNSTSALYCSLSNCATRNCSFIISFILNYSRGSWRRGPWSWRRPEWGHPCSRRTRRFRRTWRRRRRRRHQRYQRRRRKS